ncbi:hypothetical protein GIB67_033287, partial [Kingdonia uniflora]
AAYYYPQFFPFLNPFFAFGASSCTCPEAGSSLSMSFFSPRRAKGGSPSLKLRSQPVELSLCWGIDHYYVQISYSVYIY